METPSKTMLIAVPAALTAVAVLFAAVTAAIGHSAITAAVGGDIETLGNHGVGALMAAGCTAATGLIAWVSIREAKAAAMSGAQIN